MSAILVTRLDDTAVGKSIHVYRFEDATWVFVCHDDPGLDYVLRPDGRTLDVYTPWGEEPEGVPAGLWQQFLRDIGALLD